MNQLNEFFLQQHQSNITSLAKKTFTKTNHESNFAKGNY